MEKIKKINNNLSELIIHANLRNNLVRKGGNALIMVVLMFAMLLVLGTGAVTLASSTSRRAINETKQEQAYIAARSVSMAIKDQIMNLEGEDRTTYVEQLKTAVASGSADLAINDSNSEISYELLQMEPIAETNYEKFTVRATYAGASEDYSFVLTNTPVPTQIAGGTKSFMTAESVSEFSQFEMVNDPGNIASAILLSAKTGNRMNIKSNLIGDVYIADDVALETGAVINGNLIVDGDLTIGDSAITVIGNIYVSGRFVIDDGQITGSIYNGNSDYKVNNDNSRHRMKINLKNQPDSVLQNAVYVLDIGDVKYELASNNNITKVISGDELNEYNSYMNRLHDYVQNSLDGDNEDELDDWKKWPDDQYINELKNNKLVPNKPDNSDYYQITESGWLDIPEQIKNNHSIPSDKGILIDAGSGTIDIYLYDGSNGGTFELDKPIRVNGHVNFYLPYNFNLRTTSNGPIIPFDDTKPLQTFLVGDKNNKVDINSSFYGFIYMNPIGGSGADYVQIQSGSYLNFYKFSGLIDAPHLKIHPDNGSKFEFVDPNNSSDGSGGTGDTTSGYEYAGIIQ